MKVSWGVNQRDTVATKKGKPPLHPLHLLITLKARELPFLKFLHETSFPFPSIVKGSVLWKRVGRVGIFTVSGTAHALPVSVCTLYHFQLQLNIGLPNFLSECLSLAFKLLSNLSMSAINTLH